MATRIGGGKDIRGRYVERPSEADGWRLGAERSDRREQWVR